MLELMTNKNIYLEFIFDYIIGKKSSLQNLQILQIFWFFTNFQDFQLKLWDLYRLQRNDIDAWFFYHKYNFSSSTR